MSALRQLDLSDVFAAPRDLAIPDDVFLRRKPRPGARPAESVAAHRDRVHTRAFELEPRLPPLGTVIEKYRLERVIGIGGFAVVYRARHLLLDTTVAIKLLRPSVAERRPRLPTLLCEEARFAARIQHPNVVRVLDVTHADEITYLVMEHIEGLDLAVMLRRRVTLPPRMVLKIIRHVAAGLRAGLEQGLIHRDVKPSNILLSRTGVTKLTDFGLARSTAEGPTLGGAAPVGTVGYMAPEQLDRPHTVDFRADLYSLGVTAYQALVGILPFDADHAGASAAQREAIYVPAHVRQPSMPRELGALLDRLLATHPNDRPANYGELELAATAILDRLPRESTTPRDVKGTIG